MERKIEIAANGDLVAQVHDENDLPMPRVAKHPLREGIMQLEHTIPELKVEVARQELHAGLVAWIMDELDAKLAAGFNAAVVDVHVIDHPNGDSSLHAHVNGRRHGVAKTLPGREAPRANSQDPEKVP